jgi:hypothetical protein
MIFGMPQDFHLSATGGARSNHSTIETSMGGNNRHYPGVGTGQVDVTSSYRQANRIVASVSL